MRAAFAGCLVVVTSIAHADRAVVDTLSVTADMRARGRTFGEAGDSNDPSWLGGARLAVTFEEPELPGPPYGTQYGFRLVPELFAGFLADDKHAEGYLGAGARAELHIAGRRHGRLRRLVTYFPARALVIGGHQDPGVELGIGQYFPLRDHRRVGYEYVIMWRDRPNAAPAAERELNGLLSVFVSW
jgi:hypothetical protein